MKLLKISFAFLAVALLSMILIWFNLDVLFTPGNLSAMQKRFVPQMRGDWNDLKIEVKNRGVLNKEIELIVGSKSCWKFKASEVCFDRLELLASIDVLEWRKTQLDKVIVHIPWSRLLLSDFIDSSDDQEVFNIHSTILLARGILKTFNDYKPPILSLHIEDTQFKELEANANLKFDSKTLQLDWQSSDIAVQIDGEWQEVVDKATNAGLIKIQASDLRYEIGWKGMFSQEMGGDVQFTILNKLKKRDDDGLEIRELKTALSIDVSEQESVLKLKKVSVIPSVGLESVSGELCEVRFTQPSDQSTSFKCESLKLVNPDWKKLIGQKKFREQVPPVLSLNLNGYFDERNIVARESGVFSKINFDLSEVSNANFVFNSSAQVSLQYLDESMIWDLQRVTANLEIHSFEYVVKLMESTPFPIPAPLNSLKGTVKFDLADVKTLKKSIALKAQGELRLTGEGQQKVNLDVVAGMGISRQKTQYKFNLDISTLIRDIHLYVPPLDPLVAIPSVSMDPRISENKKTKNQNLTKNEFKYKVQVRSQKKNSIRLYHQLLNPYMEGAIELELRPDHFRYRFTQVNPFDLTYLKRKLKVVKVDISDWDPRQNKIKLDINTIYQAAGYDILIDVLGTAEKPRVMLSSRPSLSREDIISVLLYNRTSQDLSRSQNQNVGGTEAAIADRALGLLGIWAFASTPIESVSYNSQSQTYQAQLALPGEVKLSIGTDWEQSQFVGLRKRISENWVLVTGYESGSEDQLGNLFLEREFYY